MQRIVLYFEINRCRIAIEKKRVVETGTTWDSSDLWQRAGERENEQHKEFEFVLSGERTHALVESTVLLKNPEMRAYTDGSTH